MDKETARIVSWGLPPNSAHAFWGSGYQGGLDYTYDLGLLALPDLFSICEVRELTAPVFNSSLQAPATKIEGDLIVGLLEADRACTR